MNYEDIRSFLAVVDNKTYLEAAEALYRSQSSLSKSIQRLEKELGVVLFERTTRRVRLTAAGEELLPAARRLIEAHEGMLKTAEFHRSLESGSLRVGSIYFGKENLIVPLMAQFMELHPGIDIGLEESTTTPLINALLERTLDVVFVSSMYPLGGERKNFSRDPRFLSCSFSIDPYYVIASKKHPLAKKKELTYADLDGQRLITTDKTMDVYHEAIRAALDAHGVNMCIATHCTNVRSILHLVSENVGIAILSRLVLEEMEDKVLIPLEDTLVRDTQMVILRQKTIPPQIEAFYRFTREHRRADETAAYLFPDGINGG